MGTKHFATCNACQHTFDLHKGGTFNAYSKICSDCGNSISVRRNEGNPAKVPSISPSNFIEYAKAWHALNPVDLNEPVYELTTHCLCKGELIRETDARVVYRCPECKSPQLTLRDSGVLYD